MARSRTGEVLLNGLDLEGSSVDMIMGDDRLQIDGVKGCITTHQQNTTKTYEVTPAEADNLANFIFENQDSKNIAPDSLVQLFIAKERGEMTEKQFNGKISILQSGDVANLNMDPRVLEALKKSFKNSDLSIDDPRIQSIKDAMDTEIPVSIAPIGKDKPSRCLE